MLVRLGIHHVVPLSVAALASPRTVSNSTKGSVLLASSYPLISEEQSARSTFSHSSTIDLIEGLRRMLARSGAPIFR